MQDPTALWEGSNPEMAVFLGVIQVKIAAAGREEGDEILVVVFKGAASAVVSRSPHSLIILSTSGSKERSASEMCDSVTPLKGVHNHRLHMSLRFLNSVVNMFP
jgi:hypothetical protein